MQSKYFGISRILSTYGKPGDTDAVINILNEYTMLLAENKDCLSFYYGTVIMPSDSIDDDPFSVWVNEIWTNESASKKALQKEEAVQLEKRIVNYLAFEPEKGIQIDIRGGKIKF